MLRSYVRNYFKDMVIIGMGHLGKYLKEYFSVPDELCLTTPIQDMTQDYFVSLIKNYRHSQIRTIVNTVAKTDLLWCEQNPEQCYLNNTLYQTRLINNVNEVFGNNVKFIQISSGCVWQGPYTKDNKPFGPYTPIAPACVYTHCKALADQIMLEENPLGLSILRPRLLYSSEKSPRNLLQKLLQYPKLINTANSVSSIETIANTIDSISLRQHSYNRSEILNVYDRGVVTPFQIGCMLADAGLRSMPQMISKKDLEVKGRPKPVDVVMYDEVFESMVNPPDAVEQLERTIAEFKDKK
jgi:dTDP-4-dehydrorhamnose reductase